MVLRALGVVLLTAGFFVFSAQGLVLAQEEAAVQVEEAVQEEAAAVEEAIEIGEAAQPEAAAKEETVADEEAALEDEAAEGLETAQEGDEAEFEEDAFVTFGTATKISKDQIAILEYDFDTDQDIEVVYLVNPETVLENISAIEEIQAEDPVEIIFSEKEGQKTAKIIKKEEFALEEEEIVPESEAPLEGEQPADISMGDEE